MNTNDIDPDEINFLNMLTQYNTRKRDLGRVKPYATRWSRKILDKRKAVSTIRNLRKQQKLLNTAAESYQRTLSEKRSLGLNYNLRPIIDILNNILPPPILATEGYKTVSAKNNIRINLIFAEEILPNIKKAHITFIRSSLGGIINSTHFTFNFPDEWGREPIIPGEAQDLRIGIDLLGRISINYRIENAKQPPIYVDGNSRNNLNAAVDYLYENFVKARYGASGIYTRPILESMFIQINNILDIVQVNILNTNLVNVIRNLSGGKKSKTRRYKKKKSKKSYKS